MKIRRAWSEILGHNENFPGMMKNRRAWSKISGHDEN